jgi:hypothetical protein
LFLTSLEVPGEDELWRQIEGNDAVEEHIMEWSVEQFSHAGKTPFGYTALINELGHTGHLPMADDTYEGVLEDEALSDPIIQAILDQQKKHPVVTVEDFKSALKCVPEKTASSPSEWGVHRYKACAGGLSDGQSDILCDVYAATMTVPLERIYYPERWQT